MRIIISTHVLERISKLASSIHWATIQRYITGKNKVSPNICDDKQGIAKYSWQKLPVIFGDKYLPVLNSVELLPNMCDNHHGYMGHLFIKSESRASTIALISHSLLWKGAQVRKLENRQANAQWIYYTYTYFINQAEKEHLLLVCGRKRGRKRKNTLSPWHAHSVPPNRLRLLFVNTLSDFYAALW